MASRTVAGESKNEKLQPSLLTISAIVLCWLDRFHDKCVWTFEIGFVLKSQTGSKVLRISGFFCRKPPFDLCEANVFHDFSKIRLGEDRQMLLSTHDKILETSSNA